LAGLIGACRGFSRDFLKVLPSREAAFTAFKKNPNFMSGPKFFEPVKLNQPGAPGLDSETWDTLNINQQPPLSPARGAS
jgi:hypothetical protein